MLSFCSCWRAKSYCHISRHWGLIIFIQANYGTRRRQDIFKRATDKENGIIGRIHLAAMRERRLDVTTFLIEQDSKPHISQGWGILLIMHIFFRPSPPVPQPLVCDTFYRMVLHEFTWDGVPRQAQSLKTGAGGTRPSQPALPQAAQPTPPPRSTSAQRRSDP